MSKPTYTRSYKASDGFSITVADSSIPIEFVTFSGTIDSAYRWNYNGQVVLSSSALAELAIMSCFTIKIIRRDSYGKDYVLRLVDCSLTTDSANGMLEISRVIQWRPKSQDDKDPQWMPTKKYSLDIHRLDI